MTNQVNIYNMALSAIGTRSSVASLTENSRESNECNIWYQTVLDMVLRGAHWNFARKQGPLGLLNDATQGQPVPQPWLYEYSQPSDCVFLRSIMPTVQAVPTWTVSPNVALPAYIGPPVRFIISSDVDANQNTTNVVLTNMNQAIGVWTSRVNNPSNWDASFLMIMVKALAAHICQQLTGDKSLGKIKIEEANAILVEARRTNGNEGLTVQDHIPEWMRVRGYAADWAYPDGGYFYLGPQNLTLVS